MNPWLNLAIGYTGLILMLYFIPGALFVVGLAMFAHTIIRG